MENYIYTDLACERIKESKINVNNSTNVEFSSNTVNNITVRRMNVKNKDIDNHTPRLQSKV